MSALPQFSDVDLLGYGKRIIDLNSEITDRTFDLRVAWYVHTNFAEYYLLGERMRLVAHPFRLRHGLG